MNPLLKFGCRAYQIAFHAALPLLPYREPEIFHTIADLSPLFARLGTKSVLLVTDKHLHSSGITTPLEDLLRRSQIRCTVFDGVQPNPTVDNVEAARAAYVENHCTCLIALGGGSSMDCAKAVGARIAYPRKALDKLKGNLRVLRRIPPLIAIPTTAGTGSEVTLTAVITDSRNHYKYTMNSFPLIPRYAVLDPKMTVSLPPHLTATTGMDALTHAVEAYIGRSTSRETRNMALEATGLIFANIRRAFAKGDDLEARENMLRAAYLAGNAFSQSYVGYIHAVAHSLGGQYNTPHGLANAVLMPYVLDRYGEAAHRKLHELAIAAGISMPTESHRVGAEKFIAAIRDLNRAMNIPEKLPNIRQEDIPAMAKHAGREANPLYPVPVILDHRELEDFYRQVADWS